MSNKNAVPPYRPKAGRQRKLCIPCEAGDHSGEHNKGVGCIEIVQDTPFDWVCTCPVERTHHQRPTK